MHKNTHKSDVNVWNTHTNLDANVYHVAISLYVRVGFVWC
jgi:hypothetical protein